MDEPDSFDNFSSRQFIISFLQFMFDEQRCFCYRLPAGGRRKKYIHPVTYSGSDLTCDEVTELIKELQAANY